MIDQLPQGWATAPLSDIVDINPRHARDLDDGLMVSFAPMPALSESRPQFRELRERPLSEVRKGFTHFAEGDVLFAKITPCMENGKAAVASHLRNGLGCGTTELHVLRPRDEINPYYIYHFVHQPSFRRAAEANFTGTAGQARVPVGFMEQAKIPVAPPPEQRRIVAKLEKVLDKVDTCQRRLAKIPVLLKRFRQSVLAAACSGDLTADWREENTEIEDADALLKKVKEQRTARHQAECAEARKRGQQAPKLEWSDRTPDFSDYGLPDLPDTWQWSHVAKFGFVKGGKRLPKGESLVVENTGHPYLRIRDLRDGSVDRSEILYVPTHVYPRIENYIIRSGDVYVTIVGTIGEAGIIPPDFDRANLTENAAKIVQPVGLIPEYVASWFRSPYCQSVIQQNIHSGGQGKLALFRIEELPVPLAPLAEQQEIVRRVEELFALADQIEARYAKAKAHVEKLTQSILAKAFRGELVPQDPNDEPASVLLERIKKQNRGSG